MHDCGKGQFRMMSSRPRRLLVSQQPRVGCYAAYFHRVSGGDGPDCGEAARNCFALDSINAMLNFTVHSCRCNTTVKMCNYTSNFTQKFRK